jgi:hypothetical protein
MYHANKKSVILLVFVGRQVVICHLWHANMTYICIVSSFIWYLRYLSGVLL